MKEHKYYSIRTIIPDPLNSNYLLNDDPDVLDEICDYFNKTDIIANIDLDAINDLTKQSEVTGIIDIKPKKIIMKSEAEDQLNIGEDFRDYSLDEINRLAAEAYPLEYDNTGSRLYIISARFISVLDKLNIKNYKAVPVMLYQKYTGREWKEYFAVRYIGLIKKELANGSLLFIDSNSLVVYYHETVKNELLKLNLSYIKFMEMQ